MWDIMDHGGAIEERYWRAWIMRVTGIDLIVCTYNNAALLGQTLDAIVRMRAPGGVSWGVTVVNNNCTDDTEQVIAAHQQAGNVRELRMIHEPKQGVAEARRTGVRQTSRPMIAMLDDDCLANEDWLVELVRFAEGHERAGMMGSRVVLRYLGGATEVARRHEQALAAVDWGDEPVNMAQMSGGYLVGTGMCFTREAIEASGWLEQMRLLSHTGEKLTTGEDSEMMYRLQRAGYEAWYVAGMKVTHQIPPHRCRLEYLERLYEGLGECAPVLLEIQQGQVMARDVIERELRKARKRARSAKIRAAINRCIGRKRAWEDWRIKRARYRGRVAGWEAMKRERSRREAD